MRKAAAVGLVALAVLGPACSSKPKANGSPSPSPTGRAIVPTPAPTVTVSPPVSLSGKVTDLDNVDLRQEGTTASIMVVAYDYVFAPTFIRVAPGATVKVFLQNSGTANHTFTVDGQPVDASLDKGKTATADVKAPSSGVVTFYCRFHRSSGMQGAVYVK